MKITIFVILLYCLLAIGTILSKLCGAITVSWGLVLAPLWVPIVIIYVVVLALFIGLLINGRKL